MNSSVTPTLVIGLDFGTLSLRGLLVDAHDGAILAESTADYDDYEDPSSYLKALAFVCRELLAVSGRHSQEVASIGLDATSCSILPVDASWAPFPLPEGRILLWKNHDAQDEARIINEVFSERNEPFLPYLGGALSCEWALPKIWHLQRHNPSLYQKAAAFPEVGDWVAHCLTGQKAFSACALGYKGLLFRGAFPSGPALAALSPELEPLYQEKYAFPAVPLGQPFGTLSEDGAQLTGLRPGTVVASPVIDAHASVPGAGIMDEGAMVLILGTSGCSMLLSKEFLPVPGICGGVKDGILPGLVGYEAGQPSVGDTFHWLSSLLSPGRDSSLTLQELSEKASLLTPHPGSPVALDWWNGSRSPYDNASLKGMIYGLSLDTTPQEILRCLIEACAFGARQILETYTAATLPVSSLHACGGISLKNPLFMQLYADILGRPIEVSPVLQTCALGAAVHARAALLTQSGTSPPEAFAASIRTISAPHNLGAIKYSPRESLKAVYDGLYAKYLRLGRFLATLPDL